MSDDKTLKVVQFCSDFSILMRPCFQKLSDTSLNERSRPFPSFSHGPHSKHTDVSKMFCKIFTSLDILCRYLCTRSKRERTNPSLQTQKNILETKSQSGTDSRTASVCNATTKETKNRNKAPRPN